MSCMGHVYMAASLDGYIARLDGNLDWLERQDTKGEDYGYDAFMDFVDGLVMGRKTFEKVLSFGTWPYAKPVVVLSRTITQNDIPPHLSKNVTVYDYTPSEVMNILGEQGWKNAYVDGGKLIQSFLRQSLIKDIILSHVPVLLGSGIPLFGALVRDVNIQHVRTDTFPSGIVCSRYTVEN